MIVSVDSAKKQVKLSLGAHTILERIRQIHADNKLVKNIIENLQKMLNLYDLTAFVILASLMMMMVCHGFPNIPNIWLKVNKTSQHIVVMITSMSASKFLVSGL